MFDKGFLPDMRRIIGKLPKERQSVIYSATMPTEIERLTKEVLFDPVRIKIHQAKAVSTVKHTLFMVNQTEKTPLLKTLLSEKEMTRTLVFTRTKHKAKSLAISLQKLGFKTVSLPKIITRSSTKKQTVRKKNRAIAFDFGLRPQAAN
jgi:superfamily II DNA/RNA helicase